ncbi:patatin-like phospholipase family protein [Clostridium vincentii]|uniref:Putative sporulation hydrolase CotR n=1 Tax=Clostridium vincentii TaxID=52704 RepID=A0A2T0BIZ1_9CLOT|nr:patatin-like phospholipase family protein [Clostridium vincentii]PRR83859.1 putative sporulation hydrolase CotR [Clostridium vincentii]
MPIFRIISFDGGGVRGALSSSLFNRLILDNPSLIKYTNLFAGTSTGALISLSLAYGLTADKVDALYSFINMKKVFTPKRFNIFHPKYKNKALRDLISTSISPDATLNDLNKFIFIPSFNLKGITKKHWQGVFFTNFNKTSNHSDKIVDVALATSAAPTYFPSYNNFIDGGVITNSPAMASVVTVMHKFPGKYRLQDFRVLSIGCGDYQKRIATNTSKWGILQWSIRPFSSVNLPIISILLNDTSSLEDLYCRELLGNAYLRINPKLSEDIELDDYKKVTLLKDTANKYDLTNANLFISQIFLK